MNTPRLALGLLALWATPYLLAAPYNELPAGRFALVGYGDVKYESVDSSDQRAFSARFVPIFLFSISDRMHIEAETEISLDAEGETEVELEYADIHYFLTDSSTLTAGKFLLPFGQFSANWHPSWINRSPWTPGIYGSHGGTQAMTPLLPVLSDVGVAFQQVMSLSDRQRIFLDVFLTNGVRAAEHEEEEGEEEMEELPELEFDATNGDNNKNKAWGGRIGFALLPTLEIGTSLYRAKYDEEEQLDFAANGVDINLIGQHYLVRGEYIETEVDSMEEAEIHAIKRDGWFLQGTLQLGRLFPSMGPIELVLERAKVSEPMGSTRWAYGINYWTDARSVIKFAYEQTELDDGTDDNRLAAQMSYGF